MAVVADASRFWVFAGAIYYADGGMHDYRGAYPTVQAAVAVGEQFLAEHATAAWYHVYDSHTRVLVAGTPEQAYGVGTLRLA